MNFICSFGDFTGQRLGMVEQTGGNVLITETGEGTLKKVVDAYNNAETFSGGNQAMFEACLRDKVEKHNTRAKSWKLFAIARLILSYVGKSYEAFEMWPEVTGAMFRHAQVNKVLPKEKDSQENFVEAANAFNAQKKSGIYGGMQFNYNAGKKHLTIVGGKEFFENLAQTQLQTVRPNISGNNLVMKLK